MPPGIGYGPQVGPQVSGGNDPVRQAALRQLRQSTSTSAPTQEQLPQAGGPPTQTPQTAPGNTGGGQLAGLLLQIIQQAPNPQADLGPALAQAFQMFVAGKADQNDIQTLRAFVQEYAAIRDQIGQTQRSQIDSFLVTIRQLGQGNAGGQPPAQPQSPEQQAAAQQVAQANPQPPR